MLLYYFMHLIGQYLWTHHHKVEDCFDALLKTVKFAYPPHWANKVMQVIVMLIKLNFSLKEPLWSPTWPGTGKHPAHQADKMQHRHARSQMSLAEVQLVQRRDAVGTLTVTTFTWYKGCASASVHWRRYSQLDAVWMSYWLPILRDISVNVVTHC